MAKSDEVAAVVAEQMGAFLRERGVVFDDPSLRELLRSILGQRKDLVGGYEAGIITRREVASSIAEHIASDLVVRDASQLTFEALVDVAVDGLSRFYPDEFYSAP